MATDAQATGTILHNSSNRNELLRKEDWWAVWLGLFERAFPGLASFGSGNASVRDEDGICRLHLRHLSTRSGCEHHLAVISPTRRP
jgi:hypothetical protein